MDFDKIQRFFEWSTGNLEGATWIVVGCFYFLKGPGKILVSRFAAYVFVSKWENGRRDSGL